MMCQKGLFRTLMRMGGIACFMMGFAACGTPPPPPPPKGPIITEPPRPKVITYVVYCDPGQVKFNDKYWDVIFMAKEDLLKRHDYCIRVQGYTSLSAKPDVDKRMAHERANWVRTSLKSEGVDELFIKETMGMEPIKVFPDTPEAEQAKDQRVEIILEPCNTPSTQGVEVDPNDPFRYRPKSQ